MHTPNHDKGLALLKPAIFVTVFLIFWGWCYFAHSQTMTGNWSVSLHLNPNGTLSLNWSSPGQLEFAPTVTGPWAAAQSGVSYSGAATQSMTGNSAFFRLSSGDRTGPPTVVPVIPQLPPIASATIQRLVTPTAAGDTLLEVVFQQTAGSNSSSAIPRSNLFSVDDKVYMLRDDGVYPDAVPDDGVQTAIVSLSTTELAAWNTHVDEASAAGQLTQPVFTGRMVTGTNILTKFDLTAFALFAKIPLLPFPCSLGSATAYDWRKSIMVIDPSVVEDPIRTFDPCIGGTQFGNWTFGYLMSNICNQAVTGIDPQDFVRSWLRNWEFDQNVNFDNIPNRSNSIVSLVISNWPKISTSTGTKLDLGRAPFRLLAIVNRLDLRSHAFPYDNSGECRFVFGVLDPTNPCSTLPFTVIFEYGVPLKGCRGIKSWANQWAALNALPLPSAAFNAALQAITDQVTAPNSDASHLPNLSALNQIRANDLLIPTWDLREFTIGATGFLLEHTVKNSPADHWNNTPLITAYCNDATHQPNILLDSDTVPINYLGSPFLGGHSLAPAGLVWDGNPPGGMPPAVRIHFSLNTCNGCHAGETLTPFTHVSPRLPGAASTLSGFLTGIVVADPKGSGLVSKYDDLHRRVADLDMVIRKPCLCLSLVRPIVTPH